MDSIESPPPIWDHKKDVESPKDNFKWMDKSAEWKEWQAKSPALPALAAWLEKSYDEVTKEMPAPDCVYNPFKKDSRCV